MSAVWVFPGLWYLQKAHISVTARSFIERDGVRSHTRNQWVTSARYPKAAVTVWGFLLWVQQEEGWLVAKGHTENGFLLS